MLLQKFEIRPLGDSVIYINVLGGSEIDVEDIEAMHESIMQLSKGEEYRLLVNATEPFSMSAEARATIAGNRFATNRVAIAFVTRAMANILLGNFFIKINKPITPTKLFASEDAAFKWLQEQRL